MSGSKHNMSSKVFENALNEFLFQKPVRCPQIILDIQATIALKQIVQ